VLAQSSNVPLEQSKNVPFCHGSGHGQGGHRDERGGAGSGVGGCGDAGGRDAAAGRGGSPGAERPAGEAAGAPAPGGGAAALASGHRKGHSNNALGAAVRESALGLVRERYGDFGPTLAAEKLKELHDIVVSRETLRKWMISDGLWAAGRRKLARVHQGRPRRPRRGELVQVDGSPHRWFEERGGACTLIVYVDDATSALGLLRLVEAETVRAYMETLGEYLGRHGRMAALYSDRHSVFRVNSRGRAGAPTQFTRALRTLDIEPIHAGTPQAKGRVERANRTLQDRLVKELRLRGISDMAAANAFLPAFMEGYNRRFAVAPREPADAHRPVLHDAGELALILCPHHERTLSKNLTCRFANREYQVRLSRPGYALRGARVTVCEGFDGSVTLLRKGRALPHRVLGDGGPPVPVADGKTVSPLVDEARRPGTPLQSSPNSPSSHYS